MEAFVFAKTDHDADHRVHWAYFPKGNRDFPVEVADDLQGLLITCGVGESPLLGLQYRCTQFV